MVAPAHIEVIGFDRRPIHLGFQLGHRIHVYLLINLYSKEHAAVGIGVSHSRNDVGDRRLGSTQIQPLDFVESSPPWRRDEDNQRVVCRQVEPIQHHGVVARYELDRAIEIGNVLPSELVDVWIELKTQARANERRDAVSSKVCCTNPRRDR